MVQSYIFMKPYIAALIYLLDRKKNIFLDCILLGCYPV
jgi:hypothetical protein